jgi:hypothetical protein
MSTISSLFGQASAYGQKTTSGDLPVATSGFDFNKNLTKVRARLATAITNGQLTGDDIKVIAEKLKAIADQLKTDGASGSLTQAQLNDLSSQLNQQNRQITTLSQDGKASADQNAPKVTTTAPKTKAELLDRITKLRTNITNAIKSGGLSGDTAKGLMDGLASIQRIYGKYEAKGSFSPTQLSDLSGLVDQANKVLRSQTSSATHPYLKASATTGTGLSLVDFLT